jgi:polyhydroxyalkanoate synthesis repressor PhaR
METTIMEQATRIQRKRGRPKRTKRPREKTGLIHRYPNRRLYCTFTSMYITFAEVARRIREGEPVQIVDKKNGQDLTKYVLLQFLSEHADGVPLATLCSLVQGSEFTVERRQEAAA